jgi:hypothetical protein
MSGYLRTSFRDHEICEGKLATATQENYEPRNNINFDLLTLGVLT